MASTIVKWLEISTPGRDPYGMIGLRKLVDNDDVLAGYPGSLSPAPVLTCDIVGVTAEDVRANTETVEIGGVEFPAGTAVLFTLVAADGIAADAGKTYKAGTLTVSVESDGGYEVEGGKEVRVGPVVVR
jgi:hypothetical protein